MKKIKDYAVYKNSIKLPHHAALFLFAFGIIIAFTGCQKDLNQAPPAQQNISNGAAVPSGKDNGTVATDWYNLQLRMIAQSNPSVPPAAAIRVFSYTGISLFEAARFEIHDSKSLHGQLYEMPVMPLPEDNKKYSWVITANAAMASITKDIFPALTTANLASIDSLEAAYNARLTAEVGADVVARSQTFGDSVAANIFNWSKSDLFNHINDPYIVPVFPGAWVPTPPFFAPPVTPYLGNCRTFLRSHSHVKIIKPAYQYSEVKGSDFYRMEKHVYDVSKSLTDDQKNIAFFWNDGPGSYTPQGHDISIITQILTNSNASLATAEEAYVKSGIAMWDALIVCFQAKYNYNLIRPVSYIREFIDTAWLPLIVTPPHPEYPAAHALVTSASLEIMSDLFGRHYSFTDHTYDFRGFTPRDYNSFDQAAIECGESRVYGGIHYQQSVDIGRVYGLLIGKDADAVELTK